MVRLRREFDEFPRPFWVLFFGSIINAVGAGLVFPFLSLYMRQRLDIPLTLVGAVISVYSVASFPAVLVGGELADRLGRRTMMVFSLLAGGLATAGFGLASSLPAFLAVSLAAGLVSPLYGPAANAMLADLVGPVRRPRAFGLLRITTNLGFAMGPALGGFIAGQSYLLLFLLSALASLIYGTVVFFGTYETKPEATGSLLEGLEEGPQGFRHVIANGPFLLFCLTSVVISLLYSQMTTILPVHMKENFGLPERYFGWVMTTNAGMVTVLQYGITRWAERRGRLRMMALCAALYAVGLGSVGLGQGFSWFVGSMVVVTLGEMIGVPISNSVAADMAPPDLRGRYMGFFALTWSGGYAVGPLLGGLIADHLGIGWLWPLASGVGVVAAAGFLLMERKLGARFRSPPEPATTPTAAIQ